MRKVIILIALIAPLLVLASVAIAPTFEEDVATATVTVNSFVDITIADNGAAGLSFGSLDPGTNNNPEAAQNGVGAVNFTVQSTTNKNPVNVKLNATNFTSGATTFNGNVTADDDNAIDNATETGAAQLQLTTTLQTFKTLSPGASTGIWYWIDIPSGQAALSYTSTFGFRGD